MMDESRANEQNRRMREWFKQRTGIETNLLSTHMKEIDRLLSGKCPKCGRSAGDKNMHPNAYGLSKVQRERLVQMAKSGLYYERYLSNKFGISNEAVKDICIRMGNYVCKRLDGPDDNLKHHDGYEMTSHSSGSEKRPL